MQPTEQQLAAVRLPACRIFYYSIMVIIVIFVVIVILILLVNHWAFTSFV